MLDQVFYILFLIAPCLFLVGAIVAIITCIVKTGKFPHTLLYRKIYRWRLNKSNFYCVKTPDRLEPLIINGTLLIGTPIKVVQNLPLISPHGQIILTKKEIKKTPHEPLFLHEISRFDLILSPQTPSRVKL